MTNLMFIVGYWSGADLVCPDCARKVDIETLIPIGGDDEELIAYDKCIGCKAVYFGRGVWQKFKEHTSL